MSRRTMAGFEPSTMSASYPRETAQGHACQHTETHSCKHRRRTTFGLAENNANSTTRVHRLCTNNMSTQLEQFLKVML